MSDAARLRDSTQIQLPPRTFEALEADLTDRFQVTVHHTDRAVRLIGSPVVITEVGDYLVRRGVSVA